MKRRQILVYGLLASLSIAAYLLLERVGAIRNSGFVAAASSSVTQGSLNIVGAEGQLRGACPLKHTDVKAEISGFLARVVVTQQFENPLKEKIEAVYTFPLPQDAAVDDMTMRIGDRSVRGRIKRREEARAVYEAARAAGHVASLLDQERPNIFTQSVANIMPGEQVNITISYVETLKYEDGAYEFVFPMVVGPRYIPGAPTGKQGGGWSPDTNRVPDASRITPPVARPGTRAGHDISIEVALDAGVLIDSIKSTLHDLDVERLTPHSSMVRLRNKAEIPNKDFILRYDVAGRKVEDALLTHRSQEGGFFTFILQPPERVTIEDVTPKELVFVLDTSGSMSGFPIEKAKETMKLALEGLYPQDTFNLITFSGDTHILFEQPVHATPENLRKAQEFLASRSGAGGTEMMKAIKAALDPSDSQNHVRIVCFMTDGYVGNDMEIIGEVKRHPNARVFGFGIGSSVNRFLLDEMARQGRGEVEYVTLNDDGSAAARRFHERVRNPLLTDVSIDWGSLPVTDVLPACIPDLFSSKPVVLSGRYKQGGRGIIRLSGKMSGREFTREIAVELPEAEARHDVLKTLWARRRIADLMSRDYAGLQRGSAGPEVVEVITQLGLEFRLMTQFTSFVAVEEMTITDGGQPRRIEVPVDMPEGVSYEGVFGADDLRQSRRIAGVSSAVMIPGTPKVRSERDRSAKPKAQVGSGRGAGAGAGSGGGVGGGTGRGVGPPAGQTYPGQPNLSGSLGLADRERQQPIPRLHPSLVALVERLKKRDPQPGADEARFVRNGKAEVQIWLTDNSAATMSKLKELGFEILLEPKTAKMVIGRLPIENLEALSKLTVVRYVAPMTN